MSLPTDKMTLPTDFMTLPTDQSTFTLLYEREVCFFSRTFSPCSTSPQGNTIKALPSRKWFEKTLQSAFPRGEHPWVPGTLRPVKDPQTEDKSRGAYYPQTRLSAKHIQSYLSHPCKLDWTLPSPKLLSLNTSVELVVPEISRIWQQSSNSSEVGSCLMILHSNLAARSSAKSLQVDMSGKEDVCALATGHQRSPDAMVPEQTPARRVPVLCCGGSDRREVI